MVNAMNHFNLGFRLVLIWLVTFVGIFRICGWVKSRGEMMHRQDDVLSLSRVSSAFALVTRTNSQCFGPDKIYFPWLRTSRAE
jgi:hypothetical protein